MERPIGIEPTPEPWQSLQGTACQQLTSHIREHSVVFRAVRNALCSFSCSHAGGGLAPYIRTARRLKIRHERQGMRRFESPTSWSRTSRRALLKAMESWNLVDSK